jgi:beta-glucosidase/6-phospho-beta-glucosidase/beta-galactosidase/glycosyltransferase involved in cell wall biosynthesis
MIPAHPSLRSTLNESHLSWEQKPAHSDFIWGVGIECSFIPQLAVDQFEWTQHDRVWREDFKLVTAKLGVSRVRYALPWHKIEARPGVYDWTAADERIMFCRELGLDLMMDIMHFGTPAWLPQAVGDPRFPEALESFTREVVTRYRQQVRTWCPFNEPLVAALFSGDFGFWPPYGRKWRGYMPVLSRIVQAVKRSTAMIRKIHPEATIILCDAIESFQTRFVELENEVNLRNLRRFVVLDLLGGRVNHHHPLFDWLTSFGFSELDLDYLRTDPQLPDVIGLDYYPHSDWQLEMYNGQMRQRRADAPQGIYGVSKEVYDRYGLPLMVTETSIDGQPIAREIWLQTMVDQIKQLREEGIPMRGLIWWPLFDQIDWDGALTHRIGKIHHVGLFNLTRLSDGTLKRSPSALVKTYRGIVEAGKAAVGVIGKAAVPKTCQDPQLFPLWSDAGAWFNAKFGGTEARALVESRPQIPGAQTPSTRWKNAEKETPKSSTKNSTVAEPEVTENSADRYGIVVFSHLRWGFVWQRPQQYLSRFAKQHPVLFVEEPFFDLSAGSPPRLDLHRVLPSLTVACAHCPPETKNDPALPDMLRAWTREALGNLNRDGAFDRPLLWYYSPMDAGWSLGEFENRAIVYDCMDELSQFASAPAQLGDHERWLIDHSDVVFTGGYELWMRKKELHPNVHFYGCGVEFDHFNQAQNPDTAIPPDIDFLPRPVLGWFGVVDERVDYHLLAQIAQLKPNWSLAIVGPVVKIDPNLLPHAPNLHWLGARDYQTLPNYCRAFDVCMMPFAMNKSTEFINPTKALEYLATGRPVISTPVKDIIRQYPDLITVCATAHHFVEAATLLISNPDPERLEKGLALARSKSWESNVLGMRENIKAALTRQRRSRVIKPRNPGIAHAAPHQPTQGS